MKGSDTKRLAEFERIIHDIAEEEGLITTDIMFEIVSPQRMIEAMAYNFPTNFSHWSFGRDYEKQRTIYDYSGAGIPYEVVWNFEQPRAFLVETNPFALNVLIMAHVYGHVDFFLGNTRLTRSRDNFDIAAEARHARKRFEEYEARYGLKEVERVVDAAMSIRWHQDPDPDAQDIDEEELRRRLIAEERAKLERARDIKSEFGKPKNEKEIERIEKRLKRIKRRTPPVPTNDILRYIADQSPKPLRDWERDIVRTIRDQARFLAPNRRTKLLNEGWATYWHVRIMRRLFEEGLLSDHDHGIYNHFHSQVLRENRRSMNWYRVGLALYEYVEDRYDKGQFGPEYEDLKDPHKRKTWNTHAGRGREQLFRMRTSFTDRMAIEQFFTSEFIREQKLYIYQERYNPYTEEIVEEIAEDNPEVIRRLLKSQHTLYGIPVIEVRNGNYNNNGELYLKHSFTGFELDPRFEDGALENIFHLWGKTVHLETVEMIPDEFGNHTGEMDRILHTYDGHEHYIEEFE